MQQRLQKIIAAAGITSRRKAEKLILEGRVSVNGTVVQELGSRADPARDHVKVDGKLVHSPRDHVHILLNKPTGYVSTVSDPEGRPTVLSLLHGIRARVYPAGRLDYFASGLLLLTNDGDVANLVISRASKIPRTYHVKLDDKPRADDLLKLERGIALDGRPTAPARIRLLEDEQRPWYEITLVEGRYHQVRRMFERIGRRVVKLKRVGIAFLTDDGLKIGDYRHLTQTEIKRLKSWRPDPVQSFNQGAGRNKRLFRAKTSVRQAQ